jgi:hypothetical protein
MLRRQLSKKIRTERLTKSKVLSEYESALKVGVNYDVRQDLYKAVQSFDMESLRDFHNSHISNSIRVLMVLGSKEDLDLEVLQKYGEIIHLN